MLHTSFSMWQVKSLLRNMIIFNIMQFDIIAGRNDFASRKLESLKLRVEIENGARVFLESVGAFCCKLDVELVYFNGLGNGYTNF